MKYTVTLANNQEIEVEADQMSVSGAVVAFWKKSALNGSSSEPVLVAAFQQWVIAEASRPRSIDLTLQPAR